MSHFGILNDVTIELQRQIFEALKETPNIDFGEGVTIKRITSRSPGEKLENGTLASLYLYHIDINQHARNQLPLADRARPNNFRKPPLPLQLRYLFTPLDADEETNQMMLGRILQHFHDFPSFESVSGQVIGDAFGGASPQLHVKPDLLSLEQLSQLWNAFSVPYRIALGFLVEVVAIDSGKSPERLERVGEFLTVTGKVTQ